MSGSSKCTKKTASSKNNKESLSSNEFTLEMTKFQLDSMVQDLIVKSTAPLLEEINFLKAEVAQVKESQQFISHKYEELKK